MKNAFILRGIQGSGKSTLAAQLAGTQGHIHSADSYFMKDGEYYFDGSKLQDVHHANYRAFCSDIETGVETVVCDNCNIKHCDYADYVAYAHSHGYVVSVIALPHISASKAQDRTTHDVPLHAIERQLENWEY